MIPRLAVAGRLRSDGLALGFNYGGGTGLNSFNIGNFPNVTEYDINVPIAGPYQLDLRYASNDSRPIVVYANGSVVLSNAASKVTGGFNPEHQQCALYCPRSK